jgi:hypothetical protein
MQELKTKLFQLFHPNFIHPLLQFVQSIQVSNLCVHSARPFQRNYLHMQKEINSDLFVHNKISLHVYIHLWGWEKGDLGLYNLKNCEIKFEFIK